MRGKGRVWTVRSGFGEVEEGRLDEDEVKWDKMWSAECLLFDTVKLNNDVMRSFRWMFSNLQQANKAD